MPRLVLALIHGAALCGSAAFTAPVDNVAPWPLDTRPSNSSDPLLQCDRTVAYLFLVDSLPLADVWSEYFSGCEEGAAVAHIHAHAPISAPSAWAKYLPTHMVDAPVQGSMRFNFTFVEAMVKLWANGLRHLAPNGCEPRWYQLVSDTCAPVRTCQELHKELAKKPGESILEAARCTAGDEECFDRWPVTGWPVDGPADNPCSAVLPDEAAPKDAKEEKECRMWLKTRTAAGYNASSVSAACSFDTVEARLCAKTCCLRQVFDPQATFEPQRVTLQQPFWKASQWSTLWIEHARLLVRVAPEQTHIWKRSFVPDEHFAVNNLVMAGMPFSKHGLTHIGGYEWLANTDGAHAMTVNCTAELSTTAEAELAKAFREEPIMQMNRVVGKGGRAEKVVALGTCLDAGACRIDGEEIVLPKADTRAAAKAIKRMVGDTSSGASMRYYPTFMYNAAVTGRAIARKFAPGCAERLVRLQRSLSTTVAPGEAPAVQAAASDNPCHEWVAANAPTPRRRCERSRPLFLGAGEGKTGTTTLWYSLASLGLVSAHHEHVLRCNASAIDEPLTRVFDNQPPTAHGSCHELGGSARDEALSNKYTELRYKMLNPETDYSDMDWCALFEDYDAVLDAPIPNLLPYIYQAMGSAAKVIVSVRNASEWAARRQEWSKHWAAGDPNRGDATPLAWMASGAVGGSHPPGSGATITNVTTDVAQWLYVASTALTMCLVDPADLLVIDYFGGNSTYIESAVRAFVAQHQAGSAGERGLRHSPANPMLRAPRADRPVSVARQRTPPHVSCAPCGR